MRFKRFIGPLLLILGIISVLYALDAKQRIAEAKGNVRQLKKMFGNNIVGKMVGSELEREASKYDESVEKLFIGGIVLVIAGGVCMVYLGMPTRAPRERTTTKRRKRRSRKKAK